jgi:transcriptional regulator with XRE-family HTH domain
MVNIAGMMRTRATNDVSELLAEIQGDRTLTKFAEDLRVSKAYLSMVMSGNKPPSEKLLKRAGIRRTIKINYEVFPGAKKGD